MTRWAGRDWGRPRYRLADPSAKADGNARPTTQTSPGPTTKRTTEGTTRTMRINNNVSTFDATRHLAASTRTTGSPLDRLTSGHAVNAERSGDVEASVVQRARTGGAAIAQATRTAQTGVSFVQTTDGALGRVSSALGEIRDLTGGADDPDLDLSALEGAIQERGETIGSIARGTTFADEPVFVDSVRTYDLSTEVGAEVIEVPTITLDTTTLGLDFADVEITDADDARAAGAAAEQALATVSDFRSDLGAAQDRFESTINSLQVASENLAASATRIADADAAVAVVGSTATQILEHADEALLGQATSVSQSASRLLG
ncbi:MAG: flagellin [Acidimicrobiales bacterium]